MQQQAIKFEIEEYIETHTQDTDSSGRRTVVGNSYHLKRLITSIMGYIPIRQPWVDNQKKQERFTNTILPKYLRRMPSVNNLISICT